MEVKYGYPYEDRGGSSYRVEMRYSQVGWIWVDGRSLVMGGKRSLDGG